MKKAPKRIDAATFQAKLDTLALSVIERLKDEWPSSLTQAPHAQGFFIFSLRFCRYAYRAECEMFSDERREDHRWTWDKIVVLPPINRAILDSLFNIIFMLEDIEPRSRWYLRSGWREQKLETDRFQSQYADDEEWIEWLAKGANLVQLGVTQFGISLAEYDNPTKIQRWPSSGQMPDYEVDSKNRPPNREFLQYLNDWFYREHSGMAHMSCLGMLKLSAILYSDDLPKDRRSELAKDGLPQLMTNHVLRSAILLVCAISEIHNHFQFSGELDLRILSIWHAIMPGSPEAKDLFDRRYSGMFPAYLLTVQATDVNSD